MLVLYLLSLVHNSVTYVAPQWRLWVAKVRLLKVLLSQKTKEEDEVEQQGDTPWYKIPVIAPMTAAGVFFFAVRGYAECNGGYCRPWLRSFRTTTDYTEPAQITQKPHRSCKTASDHTEPVHRSCRTGSDHLELNQITKNQLKGCRTSSENTEPAQITQKNYKSHRTITNHTEPAVIMQNQLRVPSQITQYQVRSWRTDLDHVESV